MWTPPLRGVLMVLNRDNRQSDMDATAAATQTAAVLTSLSSAFNHVATSMQQQRPPASNDDAEEDGEGEGEDEDEDEDEPEPVPTVLLVTQWDNKTYAAFTPLQGSEQPTGGNVLLTKSRALFGGTLRAMLLSLKREFGVTNDVLVGIPDLHLDLHQDSVFCEVRNNQGALGCPVRNLTRWL